jgi:hypothetical protein
LPGAIFCTRARISPTWCFRSGSTFIAIAVTQSLKLYQELHP